MYVCSDTIAVHATIKAAFVLLLHRKRSSSHKAPNTDPFYYAQHGSGLLLLKKKITKMKTCCTRIWCTIVLI